MLSALALSVLLAPRALNSGLAVGKQIPAFEPTHVAGPDAGTKTCPICKYGDLPAVQVWINGDSEANIRSFASALDKRVAASGHDLKAFVVVVTDDKSTYTSDSVTKLFKDSYQHVAIAYIPKSDEAVGNYEFNTAPEVKNTVFVYKKMRVVKKFVNLAPTDKGLETLSAAITKVDR